MNSHDAFLKAYSEYPSQDNEGYVPDRGGFKAGFMVAWDYKHAEMCAALIGQEHQLGSRIEQLERERDTLKAQLENERMKVVACGVAALANTRETVFSRINRDNPYWSGSYQDVCSAVDREMKLREQLEAVTKKNLEWEDQWCLIVQENKHMKAQLAECVAVFEKIVRGLEAKGPRVLAAETIEKIRVKQPE